jgi:hypothetical protein
MVHTSRFDRRCISAPPACDQLCDFFSVSSESLKSELFDGSCLGGMPYSARSSGVRGPFFRLTSAITPLLFFPQNRHLFTRFPLTAEPVKRQYRTFSLRKTGQNCSHCKISRPASSRNRAHAHFSHSERFCSALPRQMSDSRDCLHRRRAHSPGFNLDTIRGRYENR